MQSQLEHLFYVGTHHRSSFHLQEGDKEHPNRCRLCSAWEIIDSKECQRFSTYVEQWTHPRLKRKCLITVQGHQESRLVGKSLHIINRQCASCEIIQSFWSLLRVSWFWFCFVLAKHSIGLMLTLDFMLPTKTVHFSSMENMKSTGKFMITERTVGLEEAGSSSLTCNHKA